MNIEWHRMVKPQSDLYDAITLNKILADDYGIVKVAPTSEFRLCDGKVGVVADRTRSSENGPLIGGIPYCTVEKMAAIDDWLRAWPDGFLMMGEFLHELWPSWSLAQHAGGHGSSSGHYDVIDAHKRFNVGQTQTEPIKTVAVNVTVNDEPGCSNGMYHEVGHVRLEVMGIGVEWNDGRLLLNPQEELFNSPIRLDCMRPMSAVVQAVYSWLLLSEADLAGISLASNLKVPIVLSNVAKVEDGIKEIRDNARWTPEGQVFATAYLDWGEDLVDRTKIALREYYGPRFGAQYAVAKDYRKMRSVTKEEQQLLVNQAKEAIARGEEPAHQRGSFVAGRTYTVAKGPIVGIDAASPSETLNLGTSQ